MKKIGLLSDTHGFLDASIFEHFSDCDEIWHAGDIGQRTIAEELQAFRPFRAVYGNIDGRDIRELYPLDLFFEVEGVKIWITHIGGYPGRYTKRVKTQLSEKPPDLFICGHSHILKIIFDKKYQLLHINPGACGHQGLHTIRTVVRFDIRAGRIENCEVIELGRRGSYR